MSGAIAKFCLSFAKLPLLILTEQIQRLGIVQDVGQAAVQGEAELQQGGELCAVDIAEALLVMLEHTDTNTGHLSYLALRERPFNSDIL